MTKRAEAMADICPSCIGGFCCSTGARCQERIGDYCGKYIEQKMIKETEEMTKNEQNTVNGASC